MFRPKCSVTSFQVLGWVSWSVEDCTESKMMFINMNVTGSAHLPQINAENQDLINICPLLFISMTHHPLSVAHPSCDHHFCCDCVKSGLTTCSHSHALNPLCRSDSPWTALLMWLERFWFHECYNNFSTPVFPSGMQRSLLNLPQAAAYHEPFHQSWMAADLRWSLRRGVK